MTTTEALSVARSKTMGCWWSGRRCTDPGTFRKMMLELSANIESERERLDFVGGDPIHMDEMAAAYEVLYDTQ